MTVPEGVPARVAVRRVRWVGAAWAAGAAVLALGPALWARSAGHLPGVLALAFVVGLAVPLHPLSCVCREVRVDPGNPDLLTGRTMTGRRTVDLGALTRVRSHPDLKGTRGYFHRPRRGRPAMDTPLVVRDRHGVALGLTSRQAYPLVADALRRHAGRQPAPKVSEAARRLAEDHAVPRPRRALLTAGFLLGCLACGAAFLLAALAIARG